MPAHEQPRESNSANGAMLSPTPAAIEVIGGTFVDLLHPAPWQLTLRAIAHGMAKTCRYGGQITGFYSVAEHSVLVHDLLSYRGASAGILRAALFHDAAEAYLGDVVAPLKWALRQVEGHTLSGYDFLTERMEDEIYTAFGVDSRAAALPDVGVADMWALRIEARVLTTSGGAHWRWPGDLPEDGELPTAVKWAGGLPWDDARVLWLDRVGAPADAYEGRDGNA